MGNLFSNSLTKLYAGQITRCAGKGRSQRGQVSYGFSLLKGKANHPMEDFHVTKFMSLHGHELGLFAIYDGHLGGEVADYLKKNLFHNILKEDDFLKDPERSLFRAYETTDDEILDHEPELGEGGSTAVNAVLIDGRKLWVANVGDSRAVISKLGEAIQLSVEHEPEAEKARIEARGGFVSHLPGDVARVNGQLAVSRAFGDKNLKNHVGSDPDIISVDIDESNEILILASDGIWKAMSNQQAVDFVINIKDPKQAAKELAKEAVRRDSKDDVSCIVVRFK